MLEYGIIKLTAFDLGDLEDWEKALEIRKTPNVNR